jgi:hypothetical protein
LDELLLDFWIEVDELPTEVVRLSDADDAAELAANAGMAAAQSVTAIQFRHFLKTVIKGSGFSSLRPGDGIARRRYSFACQLKALFAFASAAKAAMQPAF